MLGHDGVGSTWLEIPPGLKHLLTLVWQELMKRDTVRLSALIKT